MARVHEICSELDRLSSQYGAYDDPSPLEQRAYDKVRGLFASIDSELLLLEIYRRASEEASQFSRGKSKIQDLQAINLYRFAKEVIVTRLADVGTAESARLLVDMLRSRYDTVDGESALNVAHSISLVGKRALPYLESLPPEEREPLQDLIECIKQGRVYGP